MNTLGESRRDIDSNYKAPIPFASAISEAHKVSENLFNKLNSQFFDSFNEQISECKKHGGTFRGILEDYVGPDISTYFDSIQNSVTPNYFLTETIGMARRMVGLMWRFHDMGFIHGDFHFGNGGFKESKPSNGKSYSV